MPVLATDGDVALRTMRDDDADYGLLVRWRAQPHVHEWWEPDNPAPDLATVRDHYGPRTGADEHTFGVDIFIGEPDLISHGIGTRAVSLICEYLERDHGATAVALTTESTNLRAQRAYEKAGFRKVREVYDTDTRDGQRIPSWLMVRSPAPPG